MTKEQRFLLDNNLGDLVISNQTEKDYKKWVYVSQALAKYKEVIMSEFAKDLQPLIDAAVKTLNENLHLCDGDQCTLKDLRDAVEQLPNTLKNLTN